jgi:hypothetical protein
VKREHSLAIRAFDYFAAACFGAGTAVSASLLVPDSLAAPAAMLLGMVVGIVAASLLLGVFMLLLGGFEIVVMSMVIGMFAGMTGVMSGADNLGGVALAGMLVGLGIQVLLHGSDSKLHGKVEHHV